MRRAEPKALDAEAVAGVLVKLEELVGRPLDDCLSEGPPETGADAPRLGRSTGNEWSQKLAEMPVRLIEEPVFRLAGAEEAIRQMVATIEQVLQHHEPLARDLAQKAVEAYERVRVYCDASRQGQRKAPLAPTAVIELLRSFAKWRYQAQVLQHLTTAFVGLRGHLSDELREVNFCRVRLSELLRLLETNPSAEEHGSAQGPSVIGRQVFQSGCKDLREAVDLYLECVTPEHVVELDGRMEEMLRASFTALVNVCLNTTPNILKEVRTAMLRTAQEYVAGHMPATSVAALFFEHHPEASAASEITAFFQEAAPEIVPGPRSQIGTPVGELCLLATPDDEPSEHFRKLVEKTLPDTEILRTSSNDNILIYRERGNLPLADLEHLGPVGHDVYVQLNTAENFTPHSRCDIDFRLPKS